MNLLIYIQVIFHCAPHLAEETSQCEATSVSYHPYAHSLIHTIDPQSFRQNKLPFILCDVCNPGYRNGLPVSQKFEHNFSGYFYQARSVRERRWNGSNCLGHAYYEQIWHAYYETSVISLAGPDVSFLDDYGADMYMGSCDYVIVRAYESCKNDTYWEQAWVINQCQTSYWRGAFHPEIQLFSSCFLNYSYEYYLGRYMSWVNFYCYYGESGVGCKGNRSLIQRIQIDHCSMNDIKNKSYRYEVQYNATIASPTPETSLAREITTGTEVSSTDTEQSIRNQTKQSDKWLTIGIVFIILFVIVIIAIGIGFLLLVRKKNISKSGYTKTSVADADQP